jgi:hypothetical protein
MSLLNKVRDSFKWKKSNRESAAKLGISVEKYKELKRQIKYSDNPKNYIPPLKENKVVEFSENLDTGTAEIKALSLTEPSSPEEIIKLLKIDTTKWKLSSYWNKEKSDGWLISAMVTRIKEEPKDALAKVLADFKPEYQPIIDVKFINEKFDKDSIGVISTQDLHFGKEGNEDVKEDFKDAIENLVHRAYMSHKLTKIVYVIGGDLLNMDTFNGATTSGTPVDNSQRAQDAYKTAFDCLYWSINYLRQFCEYLHVVYVPGNHDRLSSYHMAHALSKCFNNEDYDVVFDVEYSERKVIVYGNNFFAFEHGDATKKNTALVYATEYPVCWGRTKYRTCYTGHFHSKKTIEYVTENEYNGFAIKHLPSLSATDYWHYHNKYVGAKKQAIMEVHDVYKGKVSEFIYTV